MDPNTGRPAELSRLLEDVRGLHSKQTSLSDKLSYMQTENQALWGEIGSLRQKHSKQQQIVSKLMEFLVHFIQTNSEHHHEQSVQQQQQPEGITTNSQTGQAQFNTNNEQGLSPNTLKRKHAALMHNDEPNKRGPIQQQEQSGQPPNLGRQQSVTINELSDHDAGGWAHAIHTSPLNDLVPSPPPSILNTDDNRWTSGHDQRNLAQQNQTFQGVGNGNHTTNTYTPDFVLQTDNRPTPSNLSGINMVISNLPSF